MDPALDKAVREAPSGCRHAVLAQAGHWYDVLALAVQNRDCGRDAALAELLEQPELRVAGPCLPATAVLNATGIGGGFCRSDGASRKKSDHLRLPELTVDAAATQGRGPPPPGSATPAPHGTVTGSSQLGPTGAIVPGAQGGEPGTGGSQSSSTP